MSTLKSAYIGTVSKVTLGSILKDGTERIWAFPSVTMPPSNGTELRCVMQKGKVRVFLVLYIAVMISMDTSSLEKDCH